MNEIFDWLDSAGKWAIIGYVLSSIVSAAARALPAPEPGNDKKYRWFYSFAQNIHANFDKAMEARATKCKHDPK